MDYTFIVQLPEQHYEQILKSIKQEGDTAVYDFESLDESVRNRPAVDVWRICTGVLNQYRCIASYHPKCDRKSKPWSGHPHLHVLARCRNNCHITQAYIFKNFKQSYSEQYKRDIPSDEVRFLRGMLRYIQEPPKTLIYLNSDYNELQCGCYGL